MKIYYRKNRMNKVIVIFGAGTGLSASVAKLYGQKGYQIALVSRNKEKLELLSKDLSSENAEASIFTADLTDSSQVKSVVSEIYESFGRIDALYYAPNPRDAFTPANEITTEILKPKIDLYLFGLINVIQEVLPIFRSQQVGTILSVVGGSAVNGFPYMSGIGPIMAASRNYLQSLHKELLSENIEVGLITVSAQIENSENYKLTKHENNADFPVVNPDILAKKLFEVAVDKENLEVFYP